MKTLLTLLLVGILGYAAAQPFTFVFLNKKNHADELPKEALDKLMDGHMSNMRRLASEGKLIAAGPFDGGGGIFIFATGSLAETGEWISTDPAVKAGRWNVEVLPFQVTTGSVCKAKEPIEMTYYTFLRYRPNVTKFNVQQAPEILRRHEEYLKYMKSGLMVIHQGNFGEDDGGIMIVEGEVSTAIVEKDPAVQEGFMDYEVKKLYIARGSFCEK